MNGLALAQVIIGMAAVIGGLCILDLSLWLRSKESAWIAFLGGTILLLIGIATGWHGLSGISAAWW